MSQILPDTRETQEIISVPDVNHLAHCAYENHERQSGTHSGPVREQEADTEGF